MSEDWDATAETQMKVLWWYPERISTYTALINAVPMILNSSWVFSLSKLETMKPGLENCTPLVHFYSFLNDLLFLSKFYLAYCYFNTCLTFIVQSDAGAEFDTRTLFSHSSAEAGKFPCAHLVSHMYVWQGFCYIWTSLPANHDPKCSINNWMRRLETSHAHTLRIGFIYSQSLDFSVRDKE